MPLSHYQLDDNAPTRGKRREKRGSTTSLEEKASCLRRSELRESINSLKFTGVTDICLHFFSFKTLKTLLKKNKYPLSNNYTVKKPI